MVNWENNINNGVMWNKIVSSEYDEPNSRGNLNFSNLNMVKEWISIEMANYVEGTCMYVRRFSLYVIWKYEKSKWSHTLSHSTQVRVYN